MAKSSTSQTPKATLVQAVLEVLKGVPQWSVLEQVFPDFTAKYALLNNSKTIDSFRVGLASNTAVTGKNVEDVCHYYISLRDFCRIINAILLVDQNNKPIVQINTSTRPANDATSKIPTSKYRTFDYHMSADPGICIIPNTNGWPITDFAKTTMQSYTQGDPTEILNIFVNFNLLESQMKSLVDSSKEQRTVYNLFDPIFAAINDAMGGINQLGFHYEESQQTFYLVDRSIQVEKKEDIPILNITGLKSSVTQFDFTTKLSPAIATMVAVSAQAAGEDVGMEAEALFRWNEGLTDRITTKRKQSISPSGTTAAEKEATHQANLKLQQGRINSITKTLNTVWVDKVYDGDDVKNAVVQYQAYTAYYLQSFKDKAPSGGPAGIVPFEVSIDMDGISGIKIGQAFQINEGIMPKKYYGTIGFIVTGVEHSISNNRWTTKLKAQTIVLEGSADKSTAPNQTANPVTGVNTEEESGIKSKPTVTPPDELVKAMRDYGITDPKERAHFLAQCAHESGGFSTKKEIWGPTAAQKNYEGRKTLGNTETGDGKKYRGRGYIQLTGRANYTAYNKSLLARGIKDDVVTNPDLVATKFAADASCYWWKNIGTGLTKLSLAGTADSNVKKVSTRVNGGSPSNGESDRIARFKGYWASISEDNSKYA
jgi:putative chitinase